MNVVPFPPRTVQGLKPWSSHELETLVSVYEAHAARGDASAWDIGATELDDPQFYVLGPAPDFEAVVAISRVGRTYVVENGTGHVIGEGESLNTLATRAKTPAGRLKTASLVARVTLGVTALRVAIEEKIQPILVEAEELLVRFAPQLAALA
jgi:hypothetical protein